MTRSIGDVIDEFEAHTNGEAKRLAPAALHRRRLADVPPEEVTWLWDGRIPDGKLTVLGGDPGIGKSYVTMALATAVTLGVALPDSTLPDRPGDVLIASYEDDAADTLRPRADLMGADVSRIHVVDGATDEETGKTRPFGPDDVPQLAATLAELNDPRLLIIDPVGSWIGAGVDTYRDNEVRAALEELRLLARDTNLAVLLIMHLRKSNASHALNRLSGSGAFGQLVRSALFAGLNPEDQTRAAIAHIKHNLTHKRPTIGYQVTDQGLNWLGVVEDLDGEDLAGHTKDDDLTGKSEAEAFLLDILADGPAMAARVQEEAKHAGIARNTLYRAKKSLKVISVKHQTHWSWTMTVPTNMPNPAQDTQDTRTSTVGTLGILPPDQGTIGEVPL